ncbi:MAG: alpha/beta hydrolase [Alphaproteobacteria bacterium]
MIYILYGGGVCAVLYGLVVLGLYLGQRHLMYHPNDARPQPGEELSGSVEVVAPPSHDGLPLHSWWLEPASDTSPVFVYFHGNAGSLEDREIRARLFRAEGWGLLLAGYRYNAGAGGQASEQALIADGKAVLDWVLARGIDPGRIVLFGESLGSGIAVAIAAGRDDLGGLVLDCPFDSIVAVAERVYWYVPVAALLRDRFDSLSRIGDVSVPILIGHGGADTIIPERHGRRLFDAAPDPKTFAYYRDARHIELFEYGFLGDLRTYIHALFPPRT